VVKVNQSTMKICVFGIPEISIGKKNLKDKRLDQVDKLVEAKKKTYAQVEVLPRESAAQADCILVTKEALPDLLLTDLEFVEMRLSRTEDEHVRSLLQKVKQSLESNLPVNTAGLSQEELLKLDSYNLLTSRPVFVASNEDVNDIDGLLVKAFYHAGYICFLTVGGKENRAWPIKNGTTALEAAGVIHSDIQKGFIRAEIISFDDLIACGGETQARRANKLRLETKNYIIQDYDVINFRFNK